MLYYIQATILLLDTHTITHIHTSNAFFTTEGHFFYGLIRSTKWEGFLWAWQLLTLGA